MFKYELYYLHFFLISVFINYDAHLRPYDINTGHPDIFSLFNRYGVTFLHKQCCIGIFPVRMGYDGT